MKRNTLFKCLAVLTGCACSAWVSAADIVLKSAALSVSIAENGYYSSMKVGNEEVLSAEKSPVVLACVKGEIVTPQKAEVKGNTLRLTMSDKRIVTLAYKETPNCVTVEATSVPDVYDVLLFGPIKVNIHDVVGDVIGVVQGRGVAVGVQALNPKTMSGLPEDYLEAIKRAYSYEGKSTELSVGSVADCRQAATEVSDGAVLQFMCRNRSRLEHRKVMSQEGAMVLPVKGPDALINGAKIAWFGCQASEALDRIGAIQAAAHAKNVPLYKLWDYPYKTLFPDLELQGAFADRLVEIFNKTGLRQISFDGLEGCAYTGHEDYSTSRFVDQFYRGLDHNVLNDASRLSHYTWHIHTRMNWGEPWGEAMRTGQVENRIKNQKY